MKSSILIVDDEAMITTTLSTLIRVMTRHEVICSNDPFEALEILSESEVDLIVSDFMMPGMNGLEFLKKAKEKIPDVITILLTGYSDKENAIRSINELGLYYYLEKPWDNYILMKVIENGLEKQRLSKELRQKVIELEKSNREIQRMYDLLKMDYQQETDYMKNIIVSLANLIEAKDEYTDQHTRRVGHICKMLGIKIGYPADKIQYLEMAGIVHDIGKISVSETVLNKPGKLTDKEYNIMKTHAEVGETICKPLGSLHNCLDAIRHHHEKLDGSGYPDGLKGDEISIEARIVSIADIFDALYSNRPYRGKLDLEEVKGMMFNEAEQGLIDLSLVKVLFELIESGELDIILENQEHKHG